MSGSKYIDRICLVITILSVVAAILFMNAKALFFAGRANADTQESENTVSFADHGIPVVSLTIDSEEYQKVIDSPEHRYKARGSVRFDLPEGYESEFGEIAPESTGVNLPIDYIRGRGNSTWLADKKSFKIKLKKKTDVLGMGESKVWVLISNVYDASLLRNRVMLELGRRYGLRFTSRCLSVDLYVNGECLGNYLLSQSIRIGKSEVDIDKIPSDATLEPEITGGYLVAMNPYPKELPDNTFTTERGVRFRLKSPIFEAKHEGDTVGTSQQRDYITDYLQRTEDAIFGENQEDADGVSWTEYMDVEDAAKYWWHQQICENPDAYRSDSTDLYKERNGKLFWGPPWDYDIALDPVTYNGTLNSISMTWLDHLRENDPVFQKALLDAWEELDPILEEFTEDGGVIDQYAQEIASSWEQDQKIRQEENALEGTSLDTQVIQLKHFMNRKRKSIQASLDQIGGDSTASSRSQNSQKDSSSGEETEKETGEEAEKNTEKETEEKTEKETEESTEKETEKNTEKETEKNTEKQTEGSTEEQTIPGAQEDDLASGISETCYWRIDSEGHMTIGPLDGAEGTLGIWESGSGRPWHKYRNKITGASFEGIVHAQTCMAMFYNCYHLAEVDLTGLETDQVTTMRGMFAWCWNLGELDVSGLDTSAATTMREMFLGCNGLTTLDLSAFDLSCVTDMRHMFFRCHHLKHIDLPESSSCAVENMNGMFADCYALESIDLSGFDTANVTGMRAMFYRCCSLPELDLTGMDTSSVTAMDYMFAECSSLTSLDLKSFDTSNVTDMSCMFLACSKLTKIDLTSFDISGVEDMDYMFTDCQADVTWNDSASVYAAERHAA